MAEPPALILASASRVRARLLADAGIDFDVMASHVDEDSVKESMLADGAKPEDVAAALAELKAVKISARHPDAMVLAADQIINQAAKWSHMLGGKKSPSVTIRAIINRGGEQGAQHSQALHSWFAHIPGLRVVMPATVQDARDLLISSVLCDDPVMYIDDRWLYDRTAVLSPVNERPLEEEGPLVITSGTDLTMVGIGYSTFLCEQVARQMAKEGISCEVIDVRVLNPFLSGTICESVKKTGRLCVVDGGWRTAGMAAEVIACVVESIGTDMLHRSPVRVTLPDAPAPTSKVLENTYYPDIEEVTGVVRSLAEQQ